MKLSIIITTRNRPHLIVPTVRETIRRSRHPETRIIVMHDEDDRLTAGVKPQLERMGARVMTVPRPHSFGEKVNLGIAAEPADVYLLLVDYTPITTEGFDQKILEAAAMHPDGHAFICGWWANLSFPMLNAVTHKMVEKMGGMYPKYYPYWFIDHHLFNVARMIDRVVFVDVVADDSAKKTAAGPVWTTNKRETWLWALLFDALAKEQQEQARSIIESPDFDETPARKRVLINNFPWVMHHSACVNSLSRAEPGDDFTTDTWYERVRANGIAKLKEVLSEDQWGEFGQLNAAVGKKVAA